MISSLRKLPIVERIQLVEDLWDSIVDDQNTLSLTDDQRMELNRRLAAYKADGIKGRISHDVIRDIRGRM